jgi:hypothetical protein
MNVLRRWPSQQKVSGSRMLGSNVVSSAFLLSPLTRSKLGGVRQAIRGYQIVSDVTLNCSLSSAAHELYPLYHPVIKDNSFKMWIYTFTLARCAESRMVEGHTLGVYAKQE